MSPRLSDLAGLPGFVRAAARQAAVERGGIGQVGGHPVDLLATGHENQRAVIGVAGVAVVGVGLQGQFCDVAVERGRALRALGVRMSMDDFGTGYSSLSYLRSFPFDKIKIDRSFVKDLARRADCLAIVRAISGLGRSLKITTTAEGVETTDQLDWLRAEGCNEVQGFLFSAAKPGSEIAGLLSKFAERASKAA